MNLPNRLTVLRVLMIPLFLFFYMCDWIFGNYMWALLVFALASLTDALDGHIARTRGLVTDFGKLMDPLADKLLVMSAFICLLQGSALLTICLIIIMAREFLVTSIRLLAAGKGVVIAADVWGKFKTIAQMVWICLILLMRSLQYNVGAVMGGLGVLHLLQSLLFAAVMVLTVFSGINYCVKNRHLFADA